MSPESAPRPTSDQKEPNGWTLLGGGLHLACASLGAGNFRTALQIAGELAAFVRKPGEDTERPLLERLAPPSS